MQTMKLMVAVLLLVVGGLHCVELRGDEAEGVFPGKAWSKKTPAQVGVNIKKLREFSQYVGDHGEFAKWSKIEIAFTGPDSRGRGEPNPFAVRFDVDFTSPSGNQYHVPGFYDGNGRGGLDGDVWKVRFTADELGQWKFKTKSDRRKLDGKIGQFAVAKTRETAQGFWKWGRLESIGTAKNRIRFGRCRRTTSW